jgi:hypothetical protein
MPQLRKVIGIVSVVDCRAKRWLIRSVASVLVVACALLFVGCNRDKPNWFAEARSPDGRMIATASTWEQGGLGTDTNQTVVKLNWTGGSQKPTIILIFDDKIDDSVNTKVGMRWLNPRHLELTYTGDRFLNFFASRCDGIDISLEKLPDKNNPAVVP